jgi:hypothetical protein
MPLKIMNTTLKPLKLAFYIAGTALIVVLNGCSKSQDGGTSVPSVSINTNAQPSVPATTPAPGPDVASSLPGTYETDNRGYVLTINPDLTGAFSITIMGGTVKYTGVIEIKSDDSLNFVAVDKTTLPVKRVDKNTLSYLSYQNATVLMHRLN